MNRRKAGLLSLLLFTVVALIHFLHMQKWIILQEVVLMTVRWIFIASLVLFAVYKKSLTTWILVAMAIGVEIGLDFPAFSQNLQFLSKIFLRLVKTIVAPLLFATLVVGIASHANLKQVGRMGWKSLLYFEVVTTIALLIGLVFINITKAGIGIKVPEALLKELPEVKVKGWQDHIIDIFPENIIKSIYEGNVLPIVLFSVVFGIALALLNEQKKKPMLNFAESLAETMFRFTNIIMYFAPFGVGAAIAVTVGHLGIDILKNLALLLVTLYLALIAFLILVLLPIAIWVAKIPIKKFIQAIREPVSIAFATTSSDSALPKALENMEKFGVPRKIVSFVIPTGYTFNLDGTTLYLSLASVFVAQAAGMDLSFGEQLMIGLTLMLTSKGVAAVPRASLVILIATATTFHFPLWPIMAIYGIDELMDMARTSVNVIGNTLASCVIARWEGEFDDDKALAFNEQEADAIRD
ncbi:MAG: cation:dicarboxylase symporter family transporter [Chitinophagaceae bacterium]|nr:cation:dicarboxylase symporter family transporter [Chitinophagaceae bacterium]MBL0304548.1 cation:dicarboxylase symporter family transporter [Chitinophagaceae bacterium]MBP6214747.1 cation:dicarboxylase symporter family transporter [Chitinophagaceae bacterium]HQV61191.1 cation:dicarboxylase symporter family transporter [Chitinophagaceae bacterium]HQV85989.1 cation:dicarboxylase symporter family transporter [Chitinophagaceae bacterium]